MGVGERVSPSPKEKDLGRGRANFHLEMAYFGGF